MDPLVNPPNIVVGEIQDIALKLGVGLHTIINTSAPQVADPSPSSLKVARPKKLVEGDLDSNHALINQYLWCPRPPIPKIPMGLKLITMVASMNRLVPPIEDSSTRRVI
jgi:hypothetical protein